MPTQDETENFILSASEVATYTICPKSWQLMYIEKCEAEEESQIADPRKLHKKWLEDFDAARKLTWASRAVIFMIVFLVVFYIFSQKL